MLSFAGDSNGDGLPILAAGAPNGGKGEVKTYEVPAIGLFATARKPGTSTLIPVGAKTVGKAFDVRVVTRTPGGKARVKLQAEVKLRGTAFNGTGLITSAAWTPTTTSTGPLSLPITGLAAAKQYHWRARLLYEPSATLPTQRSRWYYPSSDINGVHVRTP